MKKIAVFILIFLSLTFIIVHRNNVLESEKAPPVAGIFNHYIAQLAQANQACIALQNKITNTWHGRTISEKNALLGQYLQQIEIAKGKVESIEAPTELSDLKPLYLNMYDYLAESTQMQKRQLMPIKATSPDAADEQELVSSKGLTSYGQLDSFINSLQVGYSVKCLNKSATINLEKVKGNQYFVDN